MTTKAPTSRRLTRYLAGSALALGMAIGSAAVANALPEWDIGGYDSCMAGIPTIISPEAYEQSHYACCVNSGGIFKHGPPGDCVAPGVESQGRNPLPSIPPTQVMQPSPLPGHGPVIGPSPGGVS